MTADGRSQRVRKGDGKAKERNFGVSGALGLFRATIFLLARAAKLRHIRMRAAKITHDLVDLFLHRGLHIIDHDEIFDQFGFDRSVEQFIKYAKEASDNLKKLRKVRGVTD